ncbi:MAG: hypothetical protein C0394_04150 [Syntrophus sp. (in: bacteria)]|nr:hypothetical protein [Syntrophus sp. (in: bacteria)]
MLKIIQEEAAIRRYQRQFLRSFKPFVDEKISVHLGHPGASTEAKVLWSGRLGIWLHSGKTQEGRHWNAFGIGKPKKSANIPITCEINFPASGIDRRIGGALARDRKGRIFVVHRGKIGGGKKGVGKSLFADHYRGVWEIMEDGDEETTVALIGVLNSPRLARQIAQYIHKISQIKEAASYRSSQMEMKFETITFRETLVGERYCDLEKDKEAECDQGLVVRDLAECLRRRRMKVGNDGLHDLFIADDEREMAVIFQVKTTSTPLSLHAGASQLLLNSLRCTPPPRLVLVIAEKPDGAFEEKLRKLGIDILPYTWSNDQAQFPGLQALLERSSDV